MDFDHWCFACGRRNASGLTLDFEVTRGRATARYTGTREHQGYDDTLHGGIVTALLDETMGWAIFQAGVWGVTARITVTFRAPVPLADELIVTGEIGRESGRGISTHGEIRLARTGDLLAEADAIFMPMPEEKRAELSKRYTNVEDAFARIRSAIETEELARR